GNIHLKTIGFAALPGNFAEKVFNSYMSLKSDTLSKLFNKQFLRNNFPLMKEEYINSIQRIDAANNVNRYDQWKVSQRHPYFSHMADLVERDLFEVIAPLTDIKLLKVFSSIPLKERVFRQY